MKTLTNSAGSTWEYSYDESGYRTKKKLLNTTYEYMLDGSQVVCMQTPTTRVWFYYDANGQRVAMDISGTMYYYIYNLMGDVVGLYDSTGNVVARYAYDAWGRLFTVKDGSGNILNPTANPGEPGIVNPFRYRGYMYDDESGLYYLNSRYYDPEVGRFVNADSITDGGAGVLGCNLYVYAANNPVNNFDPTGQWVFKNAIKWVAKNVLKPIVKKVQKVMAKKNFTYSKGFGISISPSIWKLNLQGGVSIDKTGNIALQGTFSGGVCTGTPSASITTYQTITNAPDIDRLNDTGFQLGGSAGIPVEDIPITIGADINFIPDYERNEMYVGVTSSLGIGTLGGELHAEWGTTGTWEESKINIFSVGQGIYAKIMEW